MIGSHLLNIESCGPGLWTSGNWMGGFLCPFLETLGPAFVVIIGFTVFASLAIFTRTVAIPAVLAVVISTMMADYIPSMGAWLTMRFVVVAAFGVLFLIYMRIKR